MTDYEELSQGERGQQPGLGPLAWVAVVLICLVIAGLLVWRAKGSASPRPVPTAELVSVIPAPPSYPALPAPGENLTLGTVCPAATDHRTTLAISFELLNLTANDVTVIGVTPRLPLGGLRARGPTTAGGSCRKPGADAAGGLITAGQKRLFTMRFRLPKVCPTPLPVQAAVRLTVDQMVGTTTVPVLSDLGSVEFDSCP